MSHSLAPIDPLQNGVLGTVFGDHAGLPAPYARDVTLLACEVAGTQFTTVADFIEELEAHEVLVLRREPDNPHDANAIRVQDRQGRKVGYVPRAKNEVLAALMDAGKWLDARVTASRIDPWGDAIIHVEIRLHEV